MVSLGLDFSQDFSFRRASTAFQDEAFQWQIRGLKEPRPPQRLRG
jgi:hypothetical protein